MATGLGQTFSQNVLNWIFGKGSPTTPAGVIYVALNTGDPGVDGQTANEASGSGYAAVATAATDWNNPTAAVPSVVTNANVVTFPTATGDWSSGATFGWASLWRHPTNRTAADFIAKGTIGGTAKSVLNGDTASFAATVISCSLGAS